MIEGSGSESLTPIGGASKTYGSYGSGFGSGSATLDKQLCSVATEGFFLQFGHSVVVAAVRCGFGYHMENLVKKVPVLFYYGTVPFETFTI
jgi:hypothetical protein